MTIAWYKHLENIKCAQNIFKILENMFHDKNLIKDLKLQVLVH